MNNACDNRKKTDFNKTADSTHDLNRSIFARQAFSFYNPFCCIFFHYGLAEASLSRCPSCVDSSFILHARQIVNSCSIQCSAVFRREIGFSLLTSFSRRASLVVNFYRFRITKCRCPLMLFLSAWIIKRFFGQILYDVVNHSCLLNTTVVQGIWPLTFDPYSLDRIPLKCNKLSLAGSFLSINSFPKLFRSSFNQQALVVSSLRHFFVNFKCSDNSFSSSSLKESSAQSTLFARFCTATEGLFKAELKRSVCSYYSRVFSCSISGHLFVGQKTFKVCYAGFFVHRESPKVIRR